MSILHTTKAKLGGGLAVDCYPVAAAFCEERAEWLVFAFGQFIGPALVGLIADGPVGLERGLIVSAVALFIGAALASR